MRGQRPYLEKQILRGVVQRDATLSCKDDAAPAVHTAHTVVHGYNRAPEVLQSLASMAREIERKFLVRDTRILDGRTGDRIVQGYLAKEPGEMSTRVRIRAERAFLTLKAARHGFSLARDEFEYPIPLADARQILALHCADRIVRKTRYLIGFAAFVFEVDVFEGRHSGLILAEAELPHENTALPLPPWIGEEVTHDRRYGNFSLALLEGGGLPADGWSMPEARAAASSLVSRPGSQ